MRKSRCREEGIGAEVEGVRPAETIPDGKVLGVVGSAVALLDGLEPPREVRVDLRAGLGYPCGAVEALLFCMVLNGVAEEVVWAEYLKS